MASPNPLNVYHGQDSIQKYFDPETAPPLPLVEIPDSLNPYRQDGVRIYAKMMTMHPANNVKAMPALNLLQNCVVPGKTKAVVEYSSGSTVLSMSLISRAIHGVDDVRAFLSNKTSSTKLKLMQFFGIDITLFGGPSQPEPLDERGGIRAAQRLAQESDATIINPNQYENDLNWNAHVKWTGPQIYKQLPEINVICAGMGTSGTMTGLGTYFKDAKPTVYRLGVCTAPGDRVPGPRSFALMAPVQFPWKRAVDHIEEVDSHNSFSMSLDLCRNGIVCGPSSGFNLKGLYQLIEKRKAEGTLSDLAGPDGTVNCVFLCCDLPYQYINEYFDKLGESYFPSIKNGDLLEVDLYRYDEKWERSASEALGAFFDVDRGALLDMVLADPKTGSVNTVDLQSILRSKQDTTIIDLRQPDDFSMFHLPGAVNMPFVQDGTPSPFSDAKLLESLWKNLDGAFKAPGAEVQSLLSGRRVLITCYDGDSARVATSVLRAKGYEADSIRGGFQALNKMRQSSNQTPMAGSRESSPWVDLSQEALSVGASQSARVSL
ncbi:cysteine synthase A [Fusarium oxysporum f. sp. lycopersici 4287]|uniref:Cysteine synthase A n=2 Tax=Fusarium oxysporum TaxID=5507 RepID=A0A0J9URT7_FUSO4|nr:cysteine synthase A [Fusarium oxysporum f. sp. lycopersici 4287]EXK43964.1 cysteine synthase A [Fusarium oxysporum f. sp. melonis 26406]KAJ9427483.1 cysteine synthase [Fusarium oxysporum]KNB00956.1 cysteine synthase A [Fusarium oxysporum f. sp. lycopersici 4287]